MMQQQVRQYEATLKELEIHLGAQIEGSKLQHQVIVEDNNFDLQKKAQNETKNIQKQSVKDSKIPGRRTGSRK